MYDINISRYHGQWLKSLRGAVLILYKRIYFYSIFNIIYIRYISGTLIIPFVSQYIYLDIAL